jgi:hypothetical protein
MPLKVDIHMFVNHKDGFGFIFQFVRQIELQAEDRYEPAVLDWNNASLVFGNLDEHRLGNIEMLVGWVAPSPIVTS